MSFEERQPVGGRGARRPRERRRDPDRSSALVALAAARFARRRGAGREGSSAAQAERHGHGLDPAEGAADPVGAEVLVEAVSAITGTIQHDEVQNGAVEERGERCRGRPCARACCWSPPVSCSPWVPDVDLGDGWLGGSAVSAPEARPPRRGGRGERLPRPGDRQHPGPEHRTSPHFRAERSSTGLLLVATFHDLLPRVQQDVEFDLRTSQGRDLNVGVVRRRTPRCW